MGCTELSTFLLPISRFFPGFFLLFWISIIRYRDIFYLFTATRPMPPVSKSSKFVISNLLPCPNLRMESLFFPWESTIKFKDFFSSCFLKQWLQKPAHTFICYASRNTWTFLVLLAVKKIWSDTSDRVSLLLSNKKNVS